MSSTTSSCAEGGLVLHVFLDPQFISVGLVLSTSFSFSVKCRHSLRLIHVRTMAVLRCHSPSCTCWRDAGIGTRISELDVGSSPPAECSKLYLVVAEFKAELPVDVLHSVCR